MVYKIKDSQYGDCVQLDEYNGQWSLVAAREGSDGKIHKKWVHPQVKDRNASGDGYKSVASDKSIPCKVGGMPAKEMIHMLKFFISELVQDAGGVENTQGQKVDDSDIPF